MGNKNWSGRNNQPGSYWRNNAGLGGSGKTFGKKKTGCPLFLLEIIGAGWMIYEGVKFLL